MTDKVKLAIIDKDLRIRRLKKFPVSPDGQRIQIKQGGKGHWKPTFGTGSILWFPYRKITSFWKLSYRPVCMVINGASQCIDFSTGQVFEPDPETVEKAARNALIRNFGKRKEEISIFTWFQLLLLIVILAKLFGVIR